LCSKRPIASIVQVIDVVECCTYFQGKDEDAGWHVVHCSPVHELFIMKSASGVALCTTICDTPKRTIRHKDIINVNGSQNITAAV